MNFVVTSVIGLCSYEDVQKAVVVPRYRYNDFFILTRSKDPEMNDLNYIFDHVCE